MARSGSVDGQAHELRPAEIEAARAAVLALVAARDPGGTICPSEAARLLAADAPEAEAWRGAMGIVHAAVDMLAAEGLVRLSWKRAPLAARGGPYRIGRGRDAGQDRGAP